MTSPCAYMCTYNFGTGMFSTIDSSLSGAVRTIVFTPNGTMFIGGQFSVSGVTPLPVYFAKWNGTKFISPGGNNRPNKYFTNRNKNIFILNFFFFSKQFKQIVLFTKFL